MGAGLDTVDIAAATRHNAVVFHTPGANNQAVADHTFGLILTVARKMIFCDRSLRENRWEHTKIMGLEIWQKTLGLIGLGAIGRCVALRAKGFQMKVVAYDPYWPKEFADEHSIEQMEIEELLKVSDIVSIHVPLIAETKWMIHEKTLDLMKPSAILINAARGGIVNETDLYQALKNKVIAGAGLDVFENEPPTDSALLELDNVVLTPHTAAFTFEGMNNMSVGVVEQLIAYYHGNKPVYTVNPEAWDAQKA
jgi:D-3-phosphoglycerate dehydrogenase